MAERDLPQKRRPWRDRTGSRGQPDLLVPPAAGGSGPGASAARADGAAPASEELGGAVERVVYHNPENGFCVLRVRMRGRRDLATVVGRAAAIAPGEIVRARGRWVWDRAHGSQFAASELHVTAPASAAGIERYLASGLVRGVGPHLARALVRAFGERLLEVIERDPKRLQEVPGIGPVRAERLVAAWAEQKVVRDIMVFLHSHGLGTARAVRIYKTYGADAVSLITEDPYRLARDIRGIGFPTADALAERLGIGRDAPSRVRAGLEYLLDRATEEGHCGLPEETLRLEAEGLLGVGAEAVAEGLEAGVRAGDLVRDWVDETRCVFRARLYRLERRIAEQVLALRAGPPPWGPIDAERALPWVERCLGLALAPAQQEAVRAALASKVLVITGGPGVGKTTVMNAVLRILRAKGVRPALAAPTGRAAKRLGESTGMEAKTIHRLLEVDPRTGGFRRGEEHPIDADLVVVDETSMVDVWLMAALLRAVPAQAAVIFIGDADQLPSVGPGQVLADLIRSRAVAVVRLTEIFRQGARSRIVENAHRINRGEFPDLRPAPPESDFHFVEVADGVEAAAKVLEIVRERIPRRFGLDPIRDVQVLSPMHRGAAGARALNEALQAALNPPRSPEVTRFGFTFRVGDKVMQVENDYDRDVYNGDLGRVAAVDLEARELRIAFEDRLVSYGFDELDSVVLAYAATIHKAQGSEYPAVVVPLTTEHYPMLRRNLLYTAVTRGRRLVVLVGQRKAVAIAVRGRSEHRRWSKLADWLRA